MPKKKRTLNKTYNDVTGAPTKLTQELIVQVAGYIRVGNYVETAFMACGIPKTCFYEWMKKGRLKRGTIYSALTDAVDRAVAEGEVRDVMIIDRAANGVKAEYLKQINPMTGKEELVYGEKGKPIVVRPGLAPDWRAASWRAERRHPERWGRVPSDPEAMAPTNVLSSGDDGTTVTLDPYSIKAMLDKVRNDC